MEMTRKKPCEKQVIDLALYVNIIIILNHALTLQYLIIYVKVVRQVCCRHMLHSSGQGVYWPWLMMECAKQFSSYYVVLESL